MHRLLSLMTAISLLLAPTAAFAASPATPASITIECPAVEYVDGVPVIPEGGPAECMYIQGGSGETPVDPCAPDATGVTPEMCVMKSLPIECTPPDMGTDAPALPECPSIVDSPMCGMDIHGPVVAPEPAGISYAITMIVLADGTRIELAQPGSLFLGETGLAATVGCNQIGGDVHLTGDGTVHVGEVFATQMYCESLMLAESALLAVLADGTLRLADGDTVTLTGPSGQLTLVEYARDIVSAPENDHYGHADGHGGMSLLAILLLALPLGAAATAISIGLTGGSKR